MILLVWSCVVFFVAVPFVLCWVKEKCLTSRCSIILCSSSCLIMIMVINPNIVQWCFSERLQYCPAPNKKRRPSIHFIPFFVNLHEWQIVQVRFLPNTEILCGGPRRNVKNVWWELSCSMKLSAMKLSSDQSTKVYFLPCRNLMSSEKSKFWVVGGCTCTYTYMYIYTCIYVVYIYVYYVGYTVCCIYVRYLI